jgi:uncharacterized protein (DUF2236 family)
MGDDDSVIAQQVNAERMVLLGWARAILLQAAHPLVAAGIADHSNFKSSGRVAIARLQGTVRAMLALVFGDRADHVRSIEAIRAIHRRVHGSLRAPTGVYPAGTRYSAEDPALVLWVHVTQVESTLVVYERLIRPLSAGERDAYCAEAGDVAVELGADEDRVPRTWADVRRYLDAEYASGRIVVGPDARGIADAVLFPPMTAVPSPMAWVNRLMTLGLLPAGLREQYRYGWSERRTRQFERVMAWLRRVRRVSPAVVAWWPDARRMSNGRAISSRP